MSMRKFLLVLILLWPMMSLAAVETAPASATEGIEITVNINTASAEELATLLTGVGLKKAQAIVEFRKMHGAFQSKSDLTKVKGIGAALLAKNDQRILL